MPSRPSTSLVHHRPAGLSGGGGVRCSGCVGLGRCWGGGAGSVAVHCAAGCFSGLGKATAGRLAALALTSPAAPVWAGPAAKPASHRPYTQTHTHKHSRSSARRQVRRGRSVVLGSNRRPVRESQQEPAPAPHPARLSGAGFQQPPAWTDGGFPAAAAGRRAVTSACDFFLDLNSEPISFTNIK